jgi:hypothetical protein
MTGCSRRAHDQFPAQVLPDHLDSACASGSRLRRPLARIQNQTSMTSIKRLMAIGHALVLTTLSAAAVTPVHKCDINGSVTFQSIPCPSTEARQQPTLEQLNADRLKRQHQGASEPTAPLGQGADAQGSTSGKPAPATTVDRPARFTCDGRTHCSQMTSCAEARYFLANCPGVKMDGNHDGVPCKQQWCN